MAQTYDNSNSGVMFKNTKKTDGSKQPDYNGSVVIGNDLLGYIAEEIGSGREARLEFAGWIRASAKGTSFVSMKLNQPRQQATPIAVATAADDDCPF